jgi:putative membrane protein
MAPQQRILMDLLVGTLVLRPYVFLFLAAYLVAAVRDLGARALLLLAWVWPVAWLAEYSSTRTGFPFGLYHYTGHTRGQELFLGNVPFFDSLSFVFLAYAAWCLTRVVRAGRAASRPLEAVVAGVLMMALDVVIDPLAVRGDRWFLGHIFFYPEGGVYFGVPLSNFAGWVVVGTAGVGGYLALAGRAPARRPWGGVALYYAVVAFNLAVTAWIGEWTLAAVGFGIHAALAAALTYLTRSAGARLGFGRRGVLGA